MYRLSLLNNIAIYRQQGLLGRGLQRTKIQVGFYWPIALQCYLQLIILLSGVLNYDWLIAAFRGQIFLFHDH